MKLSGVGFLAPEEVVQLHALVIQDTGGLYGIRDTGLLASAVATPRTSVFGALAYPSLAKMAAALAWSLAKNHAFVDGNKRIAAASAAAFLELNGYPVALIDHLWEKVFVDLATGIVTKAELAALFAAAMGGDELVEV